MRSFTPSIGSMISSTARGLGWRAILGSLLLVFAASVSKGSTVTSPLMNCLASDSNVIGACSSGNWKDFIEALEKCLDRRLTPEELIGLIDYFEDHCLPPPVPAPPLCLELRDYLDGRTDLSCDQKNQVLKQRRCPYRFQCAIKDPSPPTPPPCGDCPDKGIEPPPYPSPQPPVSWKLAVSENPFGRPHSMPPKMAGVDLSNGSIDRTVVDLSLPSAGFPWTIARSYGARQLDETGTHRDVNNYQGWNWMQTSEPQLYYHSVAELTGEIERVDLLLDGETQLSFVEVQPQSGVFKAHGNAAGVVYHDLSAGTWIYYDQAGNTMTFIDKGVNGSGVGVNRFWKMEDPAGNVAYVGSLSSTSAAESAGYDGTTNHIKLAFDTNGRQYDYAYSGSTIGGAYRLMSVIVTQSTVEIARVEYAYYGDGTNDPKDTSTGAVTGLDGDLKLVSVRIPTSVSGDSITHKTHYRYYVDDSTTTTDKKGYRHTLKSIVGPEGVRRYEIATAHSILDPTYAYDSTITTYTSEYMEYHQPSAAAFNPERYVKVKYNNGECGCGGGSLNGSYQFDYSWMTAIAEWGGSPAYYGSPSFRAEVTQPDGVRVNQYTDVQGLSTGTITVATDIAGTYYWMTSLERDADDTILGHSGTGYVNAAYSPGAVDASTGFSLANGTMTTLSTGLVQHYVYYTDPTLAGFTRHTKISDGNGSAIQTLMSTTEYVAQTRAWTYSASLGTVNVSIRRPFVQYSWAYDDAQTTEADSSIPTFPTGAHRTQMDYTFWSTTASDVEYIVPQSITTTLPRVSVHTNGRGDGGSDPVVFSSAYFRLDGTGAFTRELAYDDRADAVYTYTLYSGGLPVMRKVDLDSGDGDIDSADDPLGVFGIADMASSSSGLLTQKTTFTYDPQGRLSSTDLYAELSGGSGDRATLTYYTKLADGRAAVLSIPKYLGGGTPTYYGPASYSVVNQAGRGEFSGTIGFGSSTPFTTTTAINTWINTGATAPIAAVSGSGLSLSQCSETLYDNTGTRALSRRSYTDLSTPTYLQTTFGYDNMGRLVRTVDPTGTINRTGLDGLGRPVNHSVGTDDTGEIASTLSGTSNMFVTDKTAYDSASIGSIMQGGNSYVTTRVLYPTTSSGDDRTTEYLNDFRGRAVVVKSPVSPHTLTKFDNRRAVAAGSYSSYSGLTALTDPTTTSTNRLGLSESFFDARGKGWRQVQWEIDQSTGAKTASGSRFLESRIVFGPGGEILQSRSSDAHRYNYDRLRRRTHDWSLAYTSAWHTSTGGGDTDHEVYDDLFDATTNTTLLSSNTSTGDIVLEEGRTVYDPNRNLVLVTAMVSRHHDDETTHYTSTTTTRGPLDGTSGTSPVFDVSAINGRLHGITAMYYDELDRATLTASYGDNRNTTGLMDFSYNTTAPTASATATSTTAAVLTSWRDHDKFGRTLRVHDPKDLKTEYIFDDAGRMTKTRTNAVAGSPGEDTMDTYFTYGATGLRTEMWVDKNLNGTYSAASPDFDQKTVYGYANNSSPASGDPGSVITVENLLTSVTYPDGGVVKYGYNALGQQKQMKDQAGNFIDTAFDVGGRETSRTMTTVVSPFDSTLRRINTTYGDARGIVTQIAQYSDTSASTLLDSVGFHYDNAGNLDQRTQTVDSHVWTTTLTYDLHMPDGSSNLRTNYALGELGYPDGTLVDYAYSNSGSWDKAAERVSAVSVDRADDGVSGFTLLAGYWYNGQAELIENREYFSTATGITERSLAQSLDDVNPSNYRQYNNIDAFDRVTNSWLRRVTVTTTPATFYATFNKTSMLTSAPAPGYDFDSNIIGLKDDRWALYSADFTVDGMNRLTQRAKTTGSGTGLVESFSMDRLGNFIGACGDTPAVPGILTDFNGDGNYTTGALNTKDMFECRTSNTSNQITQRSGTTLPAALSPSYDIVGNLVDDDTTMSSTTGYTYTWDAMGRLTSVTSKATSALVAEYRYSADNHRIAWRYGTSNPWYFPVYDHRWRMIAVYKAEVEADPTLQERFYYHNAGFAGGGGSMYIDSVIARDDARTNVAPPEEDPVYQLIRWMFYAQNWRGDVVGMLKSDGSPYEHVRYTSYGRPIGMIASEWDGDFATGTSTDTSTFISAWFAANPYSDFNMDGQLATQDIFDFINDAFGHSSGGYDGLASGSANRKGYAGYEHDVAIASLQLARRRYYRASFASWLRRDPAGAGVDANAYTYVDDDPIDAVDPSGLISEQAGSSGSCTSCGSVAAIAGAVNGAPPVAMIAPPTMGFPCADYDLIPTILKLMQQKGCRTPTVSTAPLGDPVCAGGATAYYDCTNHAIVVCKGPLPKKDPGIQLWPASTDPSVQQTPQLPCIAVQHELIHALDVCQGITRCDMDPNGGGPTTCRSRICTEARAYYFGNTKANGLNSCCKSGMLGGFLDYSCMRSSIRRSIGGMGCNPNDAMLDAIIKDCVPTTACKGKVVPGDLAPARTAPPFKYRPPFGPSDQLPGTEPWRM